MNLCRLFHILLLTLLCSNTQAQQPSFQHFDVNNGLPSNEIYNLFQDSKGFLWLGTELGFVKYNGNNFKLLPSNDVRGTSVTDIQEDESGKMWGHNFSGQVLYIYKDTAKVFKPWEKYYGKQLIDYSINKNGELYIVNGINYIYQFKKGNVMPRMFGDNIGPKYGIFHIAKDSALYTDLTNGKIQLITNGAIQSVNTKKKNGESIVTTIKNTVNFSFSFKKKKIIAFQRQPSIKTNPKVWIYRNQELYEHPALDLINELDINPTSILDDDDGNLFIGSFQGCYWFTYQNNIYTFKKLLFEGNGISSVIKTKDGGYWFSSLKNGIFHIPNLAIQQFSAVEIPVDASIIGILSSNQKDQLFISTYKKDLLVWNTKKNQVDKVLNSIYDRDAQALKFNPYTNELFIFKTFMGVFSSNFKYKEYEPFNEAYKDFYFGSNGITYVTGSSLSAIYSNEKQLTFLKSLHKQDSGFQVRSKDDLKSYYIKIQRCKAVLLDEKNSTLWGGFIDGTYAFRDNKTKKLLDPSSGAPIIANVINQLPNGRVCLGTINQGIYFVEGDSVVGHLTVANGLYSNRIKKIRTSEKYLWVIAGESVQRIELHKKGTSIMTYTIHDGLSSKEINDIEVLNNNVYVSTARGLQFFNESFSSKNYSPPSIIITPFLNLSDTNKRKLDYKLNNVTFQLDGAALKSRGSLKFYYRLIGLDSNWNSAIAGQTIRYPNLPWNKNFVFQAKSVNEDSIESTIASYSFSVGEPWWYSFWWLLILLGALGAGVYILVQQIIRSSQNKMNLRIKSLQTQEELRQSQLASLKAQMNPHFMFNALNSIQEFIVLNEKKSANRYMGKFADLMRMILDQSSKETVSLEDELKMIQLYLELEALRFEEEFNYSLQVDPDIDTLYTFIPAMIVQPYIENAIKHGLLHKHGNKELSVEFKQTDPTYLECKIKDNGIGRKKSLEINGLRQKKYTSFATGATQKRLELLNQGRKEQIVVSYTDYDENDFSETGTEVNLKIPLFPANDSQSESSISQI